MRACLFTGMGAGAAPLGRQGAGLGSLGFGGELGGAGGTGGGEGLWGRDSRALGVPVNGGESNGCLRCQFRELAALAAGPEQIRLVAQAVKFRLLIAGQHALIRSSESFVSRVASGKPEHRRSHVLAIGFARDQTSAFGFCDLPGWRSTPNRRRSRNHPDQSGIGQATRELRRAPRRTILHAASFEFCEVLRPPATLRTSHALSLTSGMSLMARSLSGAFFVVLSYGPPDLGSNREKFGAYQMLRRLEESWITAQISLKLRGDDSENRFSVAI